MTCARWRIAAAGAAMLLCWLGVGAVYAQDDPTGAPQPDRSVRDRQFGVVARHYGLERRVVMLQWQRTPRGYVATWSQSPIDSSTFAPRYRNPAVFPLQSRRWMASKITVDGQPLDPAVVRQLGQWRVFRPSFSALPANLAATFQPEGDGLGSADNPLAPRIGDLRIRWRELALPPLDGKIRLRDGRWQLLPAGEGAASALAAGPDWGIIHPKFATDPQMPRITLLFASLHTLLMLLLLARISRHRHRHRIGLGDGGDVVLARKIRVHANFVEHAPFALLLLGLLEVSGLAAALLWIFGGALLLGRVMHAMGLSRSGGYSIGRFYGTAMTWLALLAMALAGLWLVLA